MLSIFKKQDVSVQEDELFLQVEVDSVEVKKDIWEKAKAGAAEALYEIGEVYYARGTSEDYQKAMLWYKRSADKAYPTAINDIGYLYMEGLGVEIDYKLSMEYFLKAADFKLAMAWYNIGYMYRYGLGVNVDYILATEWLRKSSDHGNLFAHNLLAGIYKNGIGINVDYKMAMGLYEKGKDAGSAESMFQIGSMYEKGLGVSVDKQTALSYYTLSQNENHEAGKEAVKRLNSEGYYLTEKVPDEIRSCETGWEERERKRSERVKLLQKFLEEDEMENQDLVKRVIILESDKREMTEKLKRVEDENVLINEKVKKLEETISKLSIVVDGMKENDECASTVNDTKEVENEKSSEEVKNDDESDFLHVKSL